MLLQLKDAGLEMAHSVIDWLVPFQSEWPLFATEEDSILLLKNKNSGGYSNEQHQKKFFGNEWVKTNVADMLKSDSDMHH